MTTTITSQRDLLDLVEGREAPSNPILVPCAFAPGDSVAPLRDR